MQWEMMRFFADCYSNESCCHIFDQLMQNSASCCTITMMAWKPAVPKWSNSLWFWNFKWYFEYAESMQSVQCLESKDLVLLSEEPWKPMQMNQDMLLHRSLWCQGIMLWVAVPEYFLLRGVWGCCTLEVQGSIFEWSYSFFVSQSILFGEEAWVTNFIGGEKGEGTFSCN